MTDQKEKDNLCTNVFDDNNQERNRGFVRQTCSRPLIVFLSHFFVILFISLVGFGEFIFRKRLTNQLLG